MEFGNEGSQDHQGSTTSPISMPILRARRMASPGSAFRLSRISSKSRSWVLPIDGGDHRAAFARHEREHGHLAHAAGEKAVVVRGRAAALDVAEHGQADLLLHLAGGNEALHELGALA